MRMRDIAASCGVLTASIAAMLLWVPVPGESIGVAAAQASPVARVTLPSGQLIRPAGDRPGLAISPAGDRVAYVANNRLYLMRIGQGEPLEVTGAASEQGISSPLFTPDGQRIVFWSGAQGGTLLSVSVDGGTPTIICAADNPFGLAWATDGRLLIGQGPKGILGVPAGGGQPQTLVRVGNGELAHGPQLLPGGDAILYTLIDEKTMLVSGWDRARIVVQPIRGGERKVVLQQGRDARYMSNGYLLYAFDHRIHAVRFDPRSQTTSGQPVPIVEDVHMTAVTGSAHLAVTDSGALVYLPEKSGETQFGLVGLDGTKRILGSAINLANAPRLSPDGRQVAMSGVNDGNIWIADMANPAGLHKLLAGSYYNFPVFTEDGTRIILGTNLPNGIETVYAMRRDDSGELELLARPARAPEGWKPGTQTFSYITRRGARDYDLWTFDLVTYTFAPLANIPESAQLSSRFSPDGRWVAYMSNETGAFEVWAEPWPATGTRVRVSQQGGVAPLWSLDGRELYFESSGRMNTVAFQNGVFGERRELPVSGFIPTGLRRTWDLTPDGKQFVMLFRGAANVGVISNWTDLLARR